MGHSWGIRLHPQQSVAVRATAVTRPFRPEPSTLVWLGTLPKLRTRVFDSRRPLQRTCLGDCRFPVRDGPGARFATLFWDGPPCRRGAALRPPRFRDAEHSVGGTPDQSPVLPERERAQRRQGAVRSAARMTRSRSTLAPECWTSRVAVTKVTGVLRLRSSRAARASVAAGASSSVR
jgi:hypothetical protein